MAPESLGGFESDRPDVPPGLWDRDAGGNTEFADMRQAWDDLDPEDRAVCADLICEHTQLYSSGTLGFTDFTDEDRARVQPVHQRLVRTHPSSGRQSLYLASRAGSASLPARPE